MFLLCIDVAQMSRLSVIDSALVRLLGHEFSLIGCHLKPVVQKLVGNTIMKHQHEDKGTSSSTVTAVTTSHSAVVLSVNLFSLMMIRMMSSQPSSDPSQIELVEFLLRVFGHVVQDESSRPKEIEAAARFHYASHVLASAVVSHAQGLVSGSMPAAQWFETSRQRFSLLLQRLMTNSSSWLQVLKIFDAAQLILIEGSDVPEPPEFLIRRFGSLGLEQKQTASSDILRASLSGTSSGLKESVQEDFTSKLLRGFVALLPPNPFLLFSESEKRGEAFIEAVNKVARCSDALQERNVLKWSIRPTVRGCGPDCSRSHNEDGNCLVCGLGWGPHNGHMCTVSPFSRSRGSWVTSSQQASSPPQVMETTPDSIKMTFDPKSGITEGMQSEVAIERGTTITYNITHSAASTPKVILGLTRTPPPLTDPIVPKVALGLDLGELTIIGDDAQHPVDIVMLRKALSFSRSATIK